MTTDEIDTVIEVVLRQAGAKIECKVTWPDEDVTEYDLQPVSLHRAKHGDQSLAGSRRTGAGRPLERGRYRQSSDHAPFQAAPRERQADSFG